ncbi:MAG: NAD-binding protein [Pyramidobacter sp.]|nr:NAD-binding protein [Pyramidobacter sp.]
MTQTPSCPYSGHTIICGWNDRAPQILQELEASGCKAAVIARSAPALPENSSAFVICGDPSKNDVLRKAGVETADAAIILSENARTLPPDSVDSRSILTALAVESLRPEIYTVLELLNPANEIHAKRAHVDSIVFCEKIIADVIALCASQKGISSFVDDILSRSDNGTALCTQDVEAEWDGRPIGELFSSIHQSGALPLGVLRQTNSRDTEEWAHEINPDENGLIHLPLKVVCISPDEEQNR